MVGMWWKSMQVIENHMFDMWSLANHEGLNVWQLEVLTDQAKPKIKQVEVLIDKVLEKWSLGIRSHEDN